MIFFKNLPSSYPTTFPPRCIGNDSRRGFSTVQQLRLCRISAQIYTLEDPSTDCDFARKHRLRIRPLRRLTEIGRCLPPAAPYTRYSLPSISFLDVFGLGYRYAKPPRRLRLGSCALAPDASCSTRQPSASHDQNFVHKNLYSALPCHSNPVEI